MDRKSLLIILVTLGLVGGWHYGYYLPRAREEAKRYEELKREQAARQAKEPPPPAARTAQPAPVAPVVPPPPAEPSSPEERRTLVSGPRTTEYEFTTRGGGIARGILKEHFRDKTNGSPVVVNEFGEIPIGALTESPGDEPLVKLPWQMTVDESARTVSFERTDAVRLIKVTKTFVLPRDKSLKEEYLIGLDLTFTNVGEQPMMVPPYFVHTGSAAPVNESEQRMYQGFDWWRDGTNNFQDVEWFSPGGFLVWSHPERPVFQQNADLIRWAAVTSQYFTTMVTMLGEKDAVTRDLTRELGIAAWGRRAVVSPEAWRAAGHSLSGSAVLHKVDGAIGMPGFALEKGQSATRHLRIYAGPREYRRLRLLDHKEKDVLDYGSFLGIPTGIFSRMLLNSMNGLYSWTGSYFLAIILLTIIVKAILWPLQSRANKNMKKMSALQPEMKRLQEKYKEEPVKFQQEMGKVWKKAGVNPLSGCWPIFIQIPIFIGFYNMLGKAVELRHHGFWWVKDLSQPDTVATIAGIPLNPLPLLMAVTMLVQMKVTPQTGDKTQQRIFMFMPLIFIFLCYNFASALALYWTVQNLISIVQLLINRSKNAAQLQVAPAK
ncbi:MAG: YidC/Oxa1 family insertase periplasmic-domain containing protein [Chthoniobacteraceae bacterium]